MSEINITLGYKVNMGPGTFETLDINIGVKDQSKPGENTLDAFNRVYNFVESQLEDKVNEAKSDLKAGKM